jgi:glucosamine--fructose-6-phosphate aminotransferase (isomerizing)
MSMPADLPIADIRGAVETTLAWREASAGGSAIAAATAVARNAAADTVDRLAFAKRIVITGAGSSLYVAQIAAMAIRTYCRLPAEAVPLSEVLLRPRPTFAAEELANQPLVVVSRSGETTEALEVIKAARARGQHVIAVTTRPASAMARLADETLALPEAEDEAIVMTRSVGAMSALIMRLGTRLGDPGFARDLDDLPSHWQETEPFVQQGFELAVTNPSRVVVLGGGPAFGLANEAALKLTETSQVPASSFHPLEFRHGPISVCEPGVLVVGIVGSDTEAIERRVIEEAAALGATTWVLGSDGPGSSLGPIARLPLVLYALQALAFGIAVVRGKDIERPRHLGPVVVLESG